ncbi:gustatory receptor for sugar taste 43a-like [Vespula maculifrons]|uniref:Gustatory receptor n=1 Tax=Vespula maculifrons TaxID=7453 RepID=A0ABD2CNW1_VESMC
MNFVLRSKEFQKSVMPLIIANSIVGTGLIEYFVDRILRTIDFVYNILNIYKNIQEKNIEEILFTFLYTYDIFIYVITILIGLTRRKVCIAGVFFIFLISSLFINDKIWYSDANLSLNYSLMLQFYYFDNYITIIMIITDFTFIFWIKYIKINNQRYIYKNEIWSIECCTSTHADNTIDSPQHKRILRMKDNWKDVSSLSTIYRTYKVNENLKKLKRVREIHLELIKCARNIHDFTCQLIQNRLTFTACGFYDLDYTCIYNITGLIITYLVILIQIGDSPKVFFNNTNYNSTSIIIKPLIIMNSIFITGLVEYFVDDNINMVGMVYICFSIIFYLSMTYVFSFTSKMFEYKQPFVSIIMCKLYIYSNYLSHINTIVAGILRRKKVRRFTLQIENCIRIMDELNIPKNLSQFFWQQCYLILFFVFILLSMIIVDYQWLTSFGTKYWIVLIFFYLGRYPFIISLVTDITFVFWMRQVNHLIYLKKILIKC